MNWFSLVTKLVPIVIKEINPELGLKTDIIVQSIIEAEHSGKPGPEKLKRVFDWVGDTDYKSLKDTVDLTVATTNFMINMTNK